MKIKKNYPAIIAPLIVLLMLSVFYKLYDVFPFGNNTISWCDMNQQTVPLLMDLKDILDGKTSVLYSTGNAGGMNFWGVFLFFIASPFYLTVKFVEKTDIVYLVNILFAVKLACCSLTAAVYFKYMHKNLSAGYSLILSVMYALCGYGIMYCQTLVWLDIMALFPLLVMSFERLCRQNKPAMYCIILSMITAINFYIAFMIVIYILIAVPLYIGLRCNKNEKKSASVLFAGSSLVSMLVTAPVWLCSLLQISSSARGEGTLEGLMYRPLFENFTNKLCVIICTAICIAVIPFLIKNKISKIKKIRYNLILLGFVSVPVFIDPVNKIWHTGSYQSFPLRYGFVIIFTMLTLVAYYFEYSEHTDKCTASSAGFTVVIMLMAVLFTVISVYVVYEKKDILSSYIHSLKVDKDAFKLLFALFIFACLIYIICLLLQRKNLIGKKVLCIAVSCVFIGEAYTSFSVNIGYAVNNGGVFRTSGELVHDITDEPYYRTKLEKKYLHANMLGGLGYNSLAHYTSLTSEDYMFAMKKLGYSSYWMEVDSNGGTAITDALLSIKKLIGTQSDFKTYHDVTEPEVNLETGISNICCPVGIVSDKSPDNFETLGNSSRIDTQKSLAEKYFGTSEMIHEYEPYYTAGGTFEHTNDKFNVTVTDKENEPCQMRYTIDVNGSQVLYFDLFDRLSNNLSEIYYCAVQIYVDGNCITSDYPNQKNNGIICLGEYENTSVDIMIIFEKNISVKSFGVFGVDTQILKKCTDNLTGCDFYTEKNKVSGTYNNDNENNWIYMSVPYDKGLTAYINGEKTEIVKINESFCALKLRRGVNEIEISFLPQGMITAVIMAVIGIILYVLLNLFLFKNIPKMKKTGKLFQKITMLVFFADFALVFLFPLILKAAVIISDIL